MQLFYLFNIHIPTVFFVLFLNLIKEFCCQEKKSSVWPHIQNKYVDWNDHKESVSSYRLQDVDQCCSKTDSLVKS